MGGKHMGSLGRLAVRSGGRWVVEFGLWKTHVRGPVASSRRRRVADGSDAGRRPVVAGEREGAVRFREREEGRGCFRFPLAGESHPPFADFSFFWLK